MDLTMLTQDKLDALMKIAEDHKAILLKQKQAEEDAIKKAELDKVTADLMAKLEVREKEIDAKLALIKEPPKMNFGKTETSEGLPFQKFLDGIRVGDPSLAYLKTAMSEASGAVGGYLIPTEYSNKIWGQLTEIAKIIPLCTPGIMTAKTQNLPEMLTNFTIYWSTEASAKNESSQTFDQGTLTLNYCYMLMKETQELKEDEIVTLPGFIEAQVARLINKAIESQILAGTGSPFTGITAASGINSIAQMVGGNLAYGDLVALVNNTGQLEEFRDNSTFVLHRTVMALVMNMTDGNNRPIWNLNTPLGDKMVQTILGYPYKVSPNIASTKIAFGDFRQVVIGQKEKDNAIRVAFTDSATIGSDNLFEKNMVGYRFELRRAILVAWPKAFVVLAGVA